MKKDNTTQENYICPTEFEAAVDELNEMDANGGVEIVGTIYRITSPIDSKGRPAAEFVGKVDELKDEDFVGRTYGPGVYRLVYRINNGREKFKKEFKYTIGKEYARFIHAETAPEAPKTSGGMVAPGFDLGAILGGLTVEKIGVLTAAFKTIKEMFTPKPAAPPVDLTRLLEVMLTNNKQQSVSDAILIKAMDGMNQKTAAPSIMQQIKEFREIRDTFAEELEAEKDETKDDEGDDNMSYLINKAFQLLPELLQKKNNDFQAVGHDVSNNPLVAGLIQDNPDLAQEFFARAVEKYGRENAQKLAHGFGFNMDFKQQPENVTAAG